MPRFCPSSTRSGISTDAVKPSTRKLLCMDLQQGRGVFGNGPLVVVYVSPVGRPCVHQDCAALPQHVGHAESSADLHRLSPGHDDFPAGRQRRQRQQEGRGVVVDRQGPPRLPSVASIATADAPAANRACRSPGPTPDCCMTPRRPRPMASRAELLRGDLPRLV